MRKVFSSHAQVCHVWANQSQNEGRTSNIYFEGSKIYSYGSHYLAGQIHTLKGQKIALVRSDAFSPSTAKQLSRIRCALSGLMSYFCVPSADMVQDIKAASKYLDASAQDSIKYALKRSKIDSKKAINWEFERINNAFKDANTLRKLLGKVEVWPKKKQLEAVKKHLEFRLKRYQELNTPEMIEKRKVEAKKRAAKKAEKAIRDAQEKIEAFRRGENVHSLPNLPYELLRVQGNDVVTSRGARVPLDAAVTLYRAIEAGKNVIGAQIGHFTVNAIYPHRNTDLTETKVIHIGCHRILLSEAQSLLSLKVA